MTGKTQATLISYPNLHGLNIVSDVIEEGREITLF